MLPDPLEKVYRKIVKTTPALIRREYLYEAGLLGNDDLMSGGDSQSLFTPESIKCLQSPNLESDRDRRILFELIILYLNFEFEEQRYHLLKSLYQPIKVGKRVLTLQKLQDLLSNSPDYQEREHLFTLFINRLKKVNPKFENIFLSRWKLLKKDFGFVSPIEFYSFKKDINYKFLNAVFSDLSIRLDSLYEHNLLRWIRDSSLLPKLNGKPPNSCHVTDLIHPKSIGSHFYSNRQIRAFLRTLKSLGLIKNFRDSVIIDHWSRVRKTNRAACFGVRVPEEIYIVVKKRAGYASYRDLFHEGGHAISLASISPATPFYKKFWPKSGAIFELPAFLFESLLRNSIWLERVLKVPKMDIGKVVRSTTLFDLYLLKRYLGKFFYEYEIYNDVLRKWNRESVKTLYSQTLEKETKFFHDGEMYLYDLDPGVYSADYVRAWISREQLVSYLESQFGLDWFDKKSAGKFLIGMWRSGFDKDIEETLTKLGVGGAYDYDSLVRKYESFLD